MKASSGEARSDDVQVAVWDGAPLLVRNRTGMPAPVLQRAACPQLATIPSLSTSPLPAEMQDDSLPLAARHLPLPRAAKNAASTEPNQRLEARELRKVRQKKVKPRKGLDLAGLAWQH